jgi:glycosyltransferase involved in cell wall biosynthesis
MTPSAPSASPLRYVLITPARNEAEFIEQTIQSVVAQTVPPLRWVIVSDGSTDETDAIVERYAPNNAWLQLVRLPEHRDRHFAAKVAAFNAGRTALGSLDYDIIGNLDADITFEPDYFAFLMDRFAENPALGVGGTPFAEDGRTYDFRYASVEHVSGACQLFRRTCFEQIGGYTPIKGGAIDWVAVTTARMNGWQTRTFLEKTCQHHRPIGTGSGGALASQFKQGLKDYYVGGHPLWEALRSLHRMRGRPYVMAGLSLLAGYVWGALTRVKAPISAELRAFHRGEQLARLRRMLPFRRRPSSQANPC